VRRMAPARALPDILHLARRNRTVKRILGNVIRHVVGVRKHLHSELAFAQRLQGVARRQLLQNMQGFSLDQIDVTTFNDSLASPEPVMMWCARVYRLVRTDY